MEKIRSGIEELGGAWIPEANWQVPTPDGGTVFAFPAFGPENYDTVVKQVLAKRQRLPTGEQSAFMLYEACCSSDKTVIHNSRTKFIRGNIMCNSRLLVPQVNVWTPKDIKNPGMYSVFDEEGEGLTRTYTLEELKDKLSGGQIERGVRFSQDRRVAFAPLNTIKSENYEKGRLSQDGAFIAVYGIKGAEKLDEVAKAFARQPPYVWIVNNDSDKPIQNLSALDTERYFYVYVLRADFSSYGSDGYVLSVRAPSAQKIKVKNHRTF